MTKTRMFNGHETPSVKRIHSAGFSLALLPPGVGGKNLTNNVPDLEGYKGPFARFVRSTEERTPPPSIPFQELELLGENAVLQAFDPPGDQEKTETAEAGTQTGEEDTDTSLGIETQVFEMGGLGLQPEKRLDVEAVPAAREADV